MYKSAFDVEIPKDDKLTKHFKDTRNHVIHRSGYNKQGDKIEIDTMIIKDLMECCDTFVDNIAKNFILTLDPFKIFAAISSIFDIAVKRAEMLL